MLLRGQTIEWTGFLIATVGGCSYWFTSALVLAELIFVILMLTRNKSVFFFVFAGIIAALVGHMAFKSDITIMGNPNFPWFWKAATSAVFYMSLGGLYGAYESVIDKILKIDRWTFIVLLSLLYSCYCVFDFRAYNGGNYSCAITIHSAVLSIVGIMILVALCKKIPSMKFMRYWGRNTIGLYFLCGAIPNTLSIILRKIMPAEMPMLFVCWLFSLVVASIVVYILNCYMPFLFDLRKLKRKNRIYI